LKAVGEKHQVIYKDRLIRFIADFSTKTLRARRARTPTKRKERYLL
jgi:hypothetical protein